MFTVQLPTYAEKVHFAAVLWQNDCCVSVAIYTCSDKSMFTVQLPTYAEKVHFAAALCAAAGDYDRRMGGQMNGQHYFIDPAPHTMLAVPCQ